MDFSEGGYGGDEFSYSHNDYDESPNYYDNEPYNAHEFDDYASCGYYNDCHAYDDSCDNNFPISEQQPDPPPAYVPSDPFFKPRPSSAVSSSLSYTTRFTPPTMEILPPPGYGLLPPSSSSQSLSWSAPVFQPLSPGSSSLTQPFQSRFGASFGPHGHEDQRQFPYSDHNLHPPYHVPSESVVQKVSWQREVEAVAVDNVHDDLVRSEALAIRAVKLVEKLSISLVENE